MKQIKTTYRTDQFGLSRDDFCPKALAITTTLQRAGYEAYLVGGCVRDLLSGLTPKDFDIVTDATPEQIAPLFERTRIVGRRFKLVHVHPARDGRSRYDDYIEVATFRAPHDDSAAQKTNAQGMLVRDNVYGTLEEDAARRDFTLNALYYDPAQECIIDFYQGVEAIRDYRLSMIGEAHARFVEDPVRVLRAIRFEGKLKAKPDADVVAAMAETKAALADINHARLYEEVNKLLLKGDGQRTWYLLKQYGVLELLFPALAALLNASEQGAAGQETLTQETPENNMYAQRVHGFIETALVNSDIRVRSGKYVVPNFLYAVMLWPSFVQLLAQGKSSNALYDASQAVFQSQNRVTQITKRLAMSIRDIWRMQFQMSKRLGKSVTRLYMHPKFRAGYDFTLLREQSELLDWEAHLLGSSISQPGDGAWWTRYQEENPVSREQRAKAARQMRAASDSDSDGGDSRHADKSSRGGRKRRRRR